MSAASRRLPSERFPSSCLRRCRVILCLVLLSCPKSARRANSRFAARDSVTPTWSRPGRQTDRCGTAPARSGFACATPLLKDESPSGYQRVAVAADSGNGISAVLDFKRYSFVNSDLTINLLRRPVGEWICLEARTWLGPNGGGLAESTLYDGEGLIGRATQSLAVRSLPP